MLKAPRPLNETQRLSSVRSLGLLDTQAEERFDRITRLAQRLFSVESCLISLVDAKREWFKSRQGFEPLELSRDVGFCGHAILVEDVFVVGDAAADPRFEDSPLVTGPPAVRFYAGCPVRSPDGERVGTLCLMDSEPRGFPEADRAVLRDVAALVEDELQATTQVTVDALTGVANRRGFRTVAGHLLSLCRRSNTDAELIVFRLAPRKGLGGGAEDGISDLAIRDFAGLLLASFRSADVVARLDGGDFAVLVTACGCSPESAIERLEEMAKLARAKAAPGTDRVLAPLDEYCWRAGSARFDSLKHENVESLLADVEVDSPRYRIDRPADGQREVKSRLAGKL